jgi:hypothetical protein
LEQESLAARGSPSSAHAIDLTWAGAVLVLSACNTEALQLHLDVIATRVSASAPAIVILDRAGWHGAKDLKASQHLAPATPAAYTRAQLSGNIWQFMRQN